MSEQFPIGHGPGTNTGHGHVWPRPDGVKARCGGPALCSLCIIDKMKFGEVPAAPRATPASEPPRCVYCADRHPIVEIDTAGNRWHRVPEKWAPNHPLVLCSDPQTSDVASLRETVAQWMIAHGIATGHGDTLDALLTTLANEPAASLREAFMAGRLARRVYPHWLFPAWSVMTDEFQQESEDAYAAWLTQRDGAKP